MDLRPIRIKRHYLAALKEAEALWGSRPGSPESDRLDDLTCLIQAYESEHYYPIPDLDPRAGDRVTKSLALARIDLEPSMELRAHVAKVLNRVRPLMLELNKRLSEGLDIPVDVFARRYELTEAA